MMSHASPDLLACCPSCPCFTGRIEKYILRKAFDTPDKPYLPSEVLWRQKEQFSDGVGYNWIDGLKAHAETMVSDEMLKQAPHRYGRSTWGMRVASGAGHEQLDIWHGSGGCCLQRSS